MSKNILIFFLVLILSISLSNAIKILTVNETDLVSLKVKAIDEDGNKLSYSFTEPLDENGQWQTNYGDWGDYKVTVTVLDGKSNTSEDILLVVKKKNVGPTIDSFTPTEMELTIDEGQGISFSVKASDLNRDELTYKWEFDGKEVSEEQDYKYNADYWDVGMHKIRVIVSDGEEQKEREWTVKVNKVDREALLDAIGDITVPEGEVVELTLPDFKKYNLDYTISEPVGDDNIWETTYNDSGLYDVEVIISDREFTASKTIKVTVVDVDRPPVFKQLATVWMKENQRADIELEAYDPDGDNIEFSAEGLPAGASLKENKFEWATNYDTVKKESIFEVALDKFHLLYKPVRIRFTAKSKEMEVKQTLLIMVKDVNRAPVLSDISLITVNEGEEVIIKPEANDPDGDNITYYYSGWMGKEGYKTGYDDAGTYKVKVVASDGFLSDEKYVTIVVNDVNRAPEFKDIPPITTNEGEDVIIKPEANDPDGDSAVITAESLPKNSTVEDGVFRWTSGYDTVTEDIGMFVITFKASDGKAEAIKQANVTVYNVNRAPKIISLMPKADIVAQRNKKIKFEVVAEDPDGDELTYTWKFSLLEQYKSGPIIVRTFTSPGNKYLEVIISDGKNEVGHRWNVKVV